MSIESAVAAIRRGEVVGLPTDTVYGIAVDPYQRDALGLLYDAKGRATEKPIPVLAADLSDARGVGMIPPGVERHWPGALTV
ncbi:MAG TPA: Sua5/YciO/YrdC/YwlC family protein, partial [Acidimicrobiia bacterium]|nr:Sua5/YciO/YrdC/YwlC family protein [Acidimicrobiia bacterium]